MIYSVGLASSSVVHISFKYKCATNSIVVPQVISDVTTLPTYDQNEKLSQLKVQWSHEVCCTTHEQENITISIMIT